MNSPIVTTLFTRAGTLRRVKHTVGYTSPPFLCPGNLMVSFRQRTKNLVFSRDQSKSFLFHLLDVYAVALVPIALEPFYRIFFFAR